jgi:oligoribonuclease NrnB/cAMP/cGMP phosphodiesterase (DHH superfamily)
MKYCFFHKVDLDGQSSGAIVKRFVPEVELVPYNYNDEFPWDKIHSGDTVYFVDVALQPYMELVRLHDLIGDGLVVIDHHKSFIESDAYAELERRSASLHCDAAWAGCELTWKHFTSESLPAAVRLLGQYDSWRDTEGKKHGGDFDWDGEVMPFQFGMRFDDFDVDGFLKLLGPDLLEAEVRISQIIDTGRIILKYQDKQNAFAMNSSFDADIKGYSCLCINGGMRNSRVFCSKWDVKKYDFMVVFSMTRHRKWSWSFYTDKEGMDASSLAKQFGGGGHRGAAGCVTEELIF